MKTSIVLIFTAGIGLIFGPHALAQTTPCPPGGGGSQSASSTQSKSSSSKPQAAKTAPSKTQTAKTQVPTTQPKLHEARKEHGHGQSHGGVGVGIGATVDLGGIGQRRPEADPFAVPAGPQPVAARTEQKTKASRKKPKEVATADPFSHVELTGPQAKAESNP